MLVASIIICYFILSTLFGMWLGKKIKKRADMVKYILGHMRE